MEHILAMVAVENVAYHFDILYGYLVPGEFTDNVKPGARVLVSFGKSKQTLRQGIVFELVSVESTKGYKKISSVIDDDEALVSEEILSVARFLKDRTFCTYFEGVRAQIPSGFSFKTTYKYLARAVTLDHALSGAEAEVYNYMLGLKEPETETQIYKSLGMSSSSEVILKLLKKDLVIKTTDAKKNTSEASNKTVCLLTDDLDNIKLTPKQLDVVNVLKDVGSCTLKELCYFTGLTPSVVNTLYKKRIVDVFDSTYYRRPQTAIKSNRFKDEIRLTSEQNKAYIELIDRLETGGVSLLYGITGSGKTSVFLSLIDEVISRGRQVIVMVPEISLTPQIMAIFKGRYGEEVAIFHSALSAGERRDEYKRVKNGMVKIAVGTRSAVFAPFTDIGLIVIDEEQEHTYKSEASPKYHTIDVAKFRAAKHKSLVLLASATPSVISFSNAINGRYSLHILSERYGNAVLPDVVTVDMKEERKAGNRYNISSVLLQLLEKNLNDKKQSILLINRRGYNTFVACDSCGSVVNCPNCSISLTYHSANNRLMCHYCGYSMPFTKKCKECGKDDMRYSGYGTQKIEEEIAELLPEARVIRMDTDTTSSRHAFEKILLDFGDGKYDIMLGTQMVAKGLNFENVTVVGVINSDQQLNNDDYRSEERTFDLITQVVGRSGRGDYKGTAVIQTISPENHIIQLAGQQDFESFYNNEIVIRKALVYPPYCDMCVISFSGENELKVLNCSKAFFSSFQDLLEKKYNTQKVIVLGPLPARISKVGNKYRYRIIIKCKNNKNIREMISELLICFGKDNNYTDISVYADINPENLL